MAQKMDGIQSAVGNHLAVFHSWQISYDAGSRVKP